MIHWMPHDSPLGAMILAARDNALIGAWFAGQEHFSGVAPAWQAQASDPLLVATAVQLDAYFAGQRRVFNLPLAPVGTPFQQAVWRAIAGIGYARTDSYGRLAQTLGKPGAARAVGAATARNPLSIIIPCHRLLAGSGALTGYAGGIGRKHALLAHEAATGEK